MSFIKTKKAHPQAITDKALVQWQQFAKALLLTNKTRIVNIDETWFNETSFLRQCWVRRDGMSNATLHFVSPRLSMIAALDTEGRTWFTLSHATTDSNIITLFLHEIS